MTTPRNRELEAAIVADPEAPDAYLVYGDWLQEQGEDLGELVSVQAMRAMDASNTELAAREQALLAQHGRRWLGYFAKYPHTWRFGFVDSLVITEATREDLVELHNLVAARFLRAVELELLGHRTFENCNLISALAEVGMPPVVRKLTLAPSTSSPRAIDVGSLRAIWPRLARLEELTIKAGNVGFADLSLPNATSVWITTNASREVLAPLTNAVWPKLSSLTIEFTAYPYERVEIAILEPLLLALSESSTVRHLAITQHYQANALLELLAGVPLFKSLTSLSLSQGGMNAEGAKLLLDESARFAHLEKIDLSECYLPKETAEALKKRYGARIDVERQREGYPAYGEGDAGDGEGEGMDDYDDDEAALPPAPIAPVAPAGPRPRTGNPVDDEDD